MATEPVGWRSYWNERRRDAWGHTLAYARDQLPWDLAMIPSLAAIGVFLGWILPVDPWQKVLAGFVIAFFALAGPIVLVFLWNILWAPVNHARKLTRSRDHEDALSQRAREQFEHLYKYGILQKSILEFPNVQRDQLQLSKWRILALT